MQFLFVRKQAECIEETDKAEIMVAMKMGNKDVRDLSSPDLVLDHLDLCTLTTINKVIIAIMRHNLACRVTVKSRYGRVVSQYRYR